MAGMVVALSALVTGEMPQTGSRELLPVTLPALVLWGLLLLASGWLALRHHDRLQSVVIAGVIGLVTALTFVGLSAPDLALTQLSVEVVSTVLLLMGLALLPAQTPMESSTVRKIRDGSLAHRRRGHGLAHLDDAHA